MNLSQRDEVNREILEVSILLIKGIVDIAPLLVEQHLGTKHNQKLHGGRFGSKEAIAASRKRLKGDKEALKVFNRRVKDRGKVSSKTKTSKKKTSSRKASSGKSKDKEKAPKQTAKDKKLGHRSADMKKFEEGSANLKNERAAVYDKNGKELFKTDGTSTEVTFSDDQLKQMSGAVITHNHPAPKGFPDGGSFSPSDIQLMANTGAAEVRAVTENFIYVARPKIVAGRNASKNAVNFLNGYKKEVSTPLSKKFHKEKWTKQKYQVEFWHEVWNKAASDGFIEYERIPR